MIIFDPYKKLYYHTDEDVNWDDAPSKEDFDNFIKKAGERVAARATQKLNEEGVLFQSDVEKMFREELGFRAD